ncbi:MAG: DUF1207 domain-containing protein [Planctomycetota bacterium]|nr:DUF1207 domain-containing protein [Planctomycetota bacterium]
MAGVLLVTLSATVNGQIVPLPAPPELSPWGPSALDHSYTEARYPSHTQGGGAYPDASQSAWNEFAATANASDYTEPLPTAPTVAPARAVVSDEYPVPQGPVGCEPWEYQILPDSIIYKSYLAGMKEPRLGSFIAYENNVGWIWDIALGGRVGLLRYGTRGDILPQGWQIDLEGAAFPRLDLEEDNDMISTDFRAGLPVTFGYGNWQTKLAFYHLSSHLGDELMLKDPSVPRYNYSRDVLVWGQSYYFNEVLRLYGEAGWAFHSDVSGNWEFQFGADYSSLIPSGPRGDPFAAVNVHLRQEVNYSGNLVVQAGWQWRGEDGGHLLRVGAQYFNGKSEQFEFYNLSEQKVGFGLWYDF